MHFLGQRQHQFTTWGDVKNAVKKGVAPDGEEMMNYPIESPAAFHTVALNELEYQDLLCNHVFIANSNNP